MQLLSEWRGLRKDDREAFLDHYRVGIKAIYKKLQKVKKSGTLAVGKRKGRDSQFDSEAFQQDLRKKNREFRGSSSRDLSQTLEPLGTNYRQVPVPTPSHMTVLKAKKLLRYRTVGVKRRPAIGEALKPVRVECARYIDKTACTFRLTHNTKTQPGHC
eukprot:COSAG02_NODE_27121_length_616_cov_1.404255_1_plen_158_part_00